MCGRYTLRLTPAELAGIFEVVRELDALQGLTPRFNISPTQEVLVIRAEGGLRLPMWTQWGLIPSWSKDAKSAARCINARAETVAEKPSFRAAYKARRCLVPADGYYEWVPPDGKQKQPIFIHRRDQQPFAFAGIWERWRSPGGNEVFSCSFLTTEPNDKLAAVHDRMPVILPPSEYDAWLNPKATPEQLAALVTASPSEEWQYYPVSTLVNKAANEGPDCMREVPPQMMFI